MAADPQFLALFLDEAVEILNDWEKGCFTFELSGQIDAVEALYRCAHNLKSGSAAVGFVEFSQLIHKVEDLLSGVLKGKVQNSPQLVRFLLDVHTVMIGWMAGIRSNPAFVPNEQKTKLETDLAALGSGNKAAQEAAPAPEVSVAAATTSMPPATPDVAAGGNNNNNNHNSKAKPVESVRVPANKLDLLIQLVGDLSTQQAILWHAWQNGTLTSKSCDNAIQLTQKNCKELQGVALALRMQPLEPLFQRLERAARDLARKQEKKIEIIAKGDHVELDKVVIERVTEALMHVIRNAIDHGIEGPVDRETQGKRPVATLRLEGSQEPGGILIKISDDGRGLNLDRILKKAIEKGLARSDQSYTDAEIQRFIFLPGFSTAEKVSDVSGRGVGMDVVKTAVQSIGGGISIASTQGEGTTFSIQLPTTMSIVDSLIITSGGDSYAIPLQDVAEIIDLSSFHLETAASRGRMLSLRASVIPVEYLKDHLPASPESKVPKGVHLTDRAADKRVGSIQPALLVRAGADTLAFQVDHVVGQQSVSIRSLPSGIDTLPGYTGAAILGDGDPCLILNLPELARRHIERLDHDARAIANKKGDTAATRIAALEAKKAAEAAAPEEHVTELRHLVFKVNEKTLATPLLAVREILSDAPYSKVLDPTGQDYILGRIDVRGQILPVVDLGRSLKLRREQATGPLIVVETERRTVAVVVDRIEAVADLVVAESGPSAHVARYRGELISTIDLKSLSNDVSVALEAV